MMGRQPMVSPARGDDVAGETGRWRLWLEAMRPRTLPASMAPVAISVVIAADDGAAHVGAALAALTAATAIQIGANFANDYSDFRKGTDNAPKLGRRRLLPSGLVSPAAMARAAGAAFAVACLAGLYLTYRSGWPVVIIGVASILAGVLYTGGPRPYGYRGLGEVFVLVFFGPVATAGGYFVQALSVDWRLVVAGLGPGLIACAILAVNNLRDADSDAASGKRTLAVMLGKRFARMEHAACIVAGAAGVPLALVLAGAAGPWALLPMLTLLPALPVIRTVMVENDPDRLNAALGATGRLLALFAALFCVGWLL